VPSPGECLRAVRERRNLSLRAAAKKAGINTSTLHRIETDRQDARAPQLKALATIYETTVAELVGEGSATL
jgi:transcriptional regulator with XRE-family HTH domain